MKKTGILNSLLILFIVHGFSNARAEDHKGGDSHKHDEAEKEKDDHKESEEGHGHEEGGHEEEAPANVGPNLAITEAHETKGIKLNPKTQARIGVEFSEVILVGKNLAIPLSSLIEERGTHIVYFLNDSWLTMVRVKVLSKTKDTAVIENKYLGSVDKVVSKNLGLVRLAHLEAFGASGDGHGH